MQSNLSESEKEKIRKRCSKLKYIGHGKVHRFKVRQARQLAREFDYFESLPVTGYYGLTNRRLLGARKIFETYITFLIEESLKKNLDVYITRFGVMRIKEINSVGKKRIYFTSEGEKIHRLDTIFDKKLMYWLDFRPFIQSKFNYYVNFNIKLKLMKSMLFKTYNRNLEPGTFTQAP